MQSRSDSTRGPRRALIGTVLALAVSVSACAYAGPAVPVQGSPAGVAALSGVWSGTYRYVDGGRQGSIFFRLEDDGGVAQGDVLMAVDNNGVPSIRRDTTDPWSDSSPADRFLDISFVRADAGSVAGRLGAYEDPECGCLVETTFTGTVTADRIEGTFVAAHAAGTARDGVWSVVRRGGN